MITKRSQYNSFVTWSQRRQVIARCLSITVSICGRDPTVLMLLMPRPVSHATASQPPALRRLSRSVDTSQFAVVDRPNTILVYDSATGALQHRLVVNVQVEQVCLMVQASDCASAAPPVM